MDTPPSRLSPLGQRARDLAIAMTGWPSVTATADEARWPHRLAEWLRSLPYFQEHPEHCEVLPIPGDPHGRANLMALVRGSGDAVVTLAGHFDTVPIDDYTDLEPLATSPDALRAALLSRLETAGTHRLAHDDLASGAFLPGRGLLDMKSGLAAGLAVLEAFAAEPAREGNLLLIATADEEDRSVGMRAAADALPDVLAELGLRPVLGLNLDALIDNGDGSEGRVIALGCIGKLLLSAFVVGRDAHACYPLNGVNAAHLAAELVCALEYAPELGEEAAGELASPPTALGSRDLKSLYNVTTPSRAWVIWNVLTQRRRATDVLRIASGLAREAMQRARTRLEERAAALTSGPVLGSGWDDLPVIGFAELRTLAASRDPDFIERFATRAVELMGRSDLDLPSRCRILTELTWEAASLEGPAIVLGFASMPYPAVNLPDTPAAATLEAKVRRVAAQASARHETSIRLVRHLPVIVDMSFLGQIDAEDLRHAAENTPIWGSSIRWDLTRPPTPGIPMLNVGPWGRDYHHWLERVHEPYAYGVLPELVRDLAAAALEEP